VVVAKSMGGCTAPLVAARRPVRSLVFVGALLPQPGRTLADLFAAEPMILPGATDGVEAGEDKLRRWTDEREARAHLWHDADDATAAWAFRALRPQSVTPYFEPFPLDAYPDCERTYVVCRDDRTVSPDWGREAAPRILGVDAVEIDGGHSPGIVRPAELADLLGA
jgi:pimeloyl-ACP methyl ester carboxylesterase